MCMKYVCEICMKYVQKAFFKGKFMCAPSFLTICVHSLEGTLTTMKFSKLALLYYFRLHYYFAT